MKSKLVLLFFLLAFVTTSHSQTYVFGELSGNPIDATGWNITGNAFVNGSQIDITNPAGFQSGSIFIKHRLILVLVTNGVSILISEFLTVQLLMVWLFVS